VNNSDNITNAQPSIPLRNRFDEIKRVFSLTEKELAEVLLVDSPDTLVGWTKDISPIIEKIAIDRIFSLVMLTKDWESHGYTVSRDTLHRPIIEEECLFSMLSAQHLDKSLVLFVGSRLTLIELNESVFPDPLPKVQCLS
jgi:hypothetical protein